MLQPKLLFFTRYFARNYSHFKPAYFTQNHEWLSIVSKDEGKLRTRVGITEYSQKALGDIVFIDLPKAGSLYHKDDAIAVVESAKGATDVYSPVTGKVFQVNAALSQKPSLLNKSAEDAGWICELEVDEGIIESSHLLSREGYEKFCKATMEEILKEATMHAPIFQVKSKDVSFLHSPDEFYQKILQKIELATEKILISTLYIGTDDLSRNMVKKIEDQLQKVPGLKLQLMIDHSRGSRDSFNSFSLISPLLSRFGSDRVQVLAYRNPRSTAFPGVLPAKVKEFIGVHHMKFLVFDDSLILTGANLNEIYFRDRIDRYIVLNKAKELVNYLQSIFNGLGSIYDSIYEAGACESPHHRRSFTIPPFEDSFNVKDRVDTDSIYIIPSLQLGKHGIQQDSSLLERLLACQENLIKAHSKVLFCTSYFNPKDTLLDHIMSSKAKWKILTSAPQANSFNGAKGAIGIVPSLYQHRLQLFAQKVKKSNANIECFEFLRPGFTFHAKGFLSTLRDGSTLSCIGSSNFGFRSASRDNEIQFYMLSQDSDFNAELTRSFKNLFSFGKLFDSSANNHGLITKWLSCILRKYL